MGIRWRLLVVRCWWLVVGCWLIVVGFCHLDFGIRPYYTNLVISGLVNELEFGF
jgi:hypothetical protein